MKEAEQWPPEYALVARLRGLTFGGKEKDS